MTGGAPYHVYEVSLSDGTLRRIHIRRKEDWCGVTDTRDANGNRTIHIDDHPVIKVVDLETDEALDPTAWVDYMERFIKLFTKEA